jgi:hypothetical protein
LQAKGCSKEFLVADCGFSYNIPNFEGDEICNIYIPESLCGLVRGLVPGAVFPVISPFPAFHITPGLV